MTIGAESKASTLGIYREQFSRACKPKSKLRTVREKKGGNEGKV